MDRDGWSHTEMVEACRLVLNAVQGTVTEYETDVPLTAPDWPAEVVAAADVLRGVASRTGRVEKSGYAETGLVRMASDELWSAFVTFAPWAYSATASDDSGRVVSLADESQSIVVYLDGPQLEVLRQVIEPTRLVPEKEWRAVQKQRRKR
ncbi:hypothetical protein [Streptomyces sp. SID13031]|uniref:hypothetical protein n=1 Tax=Streptomyces sp. SID13031 TaxID=2706046 RepID=UPI0013C7B354|nr:hypothetical protein [Streptomyces sp. SID13031]NEA31483.1 hypothetical protein [Streptomyces sp. SID13031]